MSIIMIVRFEGRILLVVAQE